MSCIEVDTYLKTPDALTLEEIQNQFGTITVAGEDTTASIPPLHKYK